ncbi:MAG: hypothetical protein GWO20_11820 [Candidatus Korarchaeota archaeon]|nr:hypothetical protein [Candidatus Korarchaeota archaeon]NIU84120.1 hypothetical protein [Candidatus Thorarchaeota archaeon]NIW14260.1 hypothetical protein [Candidatus Thorarchaeota archaeon]NIW52356.1 hypothetical protein [Candidatus Korarchaeota archaeon]
MQPPKKIYGILIILLYASVALSLGMVSYVHVGPLAHKSNAIEIWTRGQLHAGFYFKVDIFSSEKRTLKNVIFWIVQSNSSEVISVSIVSQNVASALLPVHVTQLMGYSVYPTEEYYIFPYTIHIPKAKEYFKTSKGGEVEWKILKDNKAWDTRTFKFARIANGSTTRIETWVLDRDTHLAKQIHIESLGERRQTTTIQVKEHSGGLKNMDELKMISLGALFLSPFVGAVVLWIISGNVYQEESSNRIQQEKDRLESEGYREQYLQRHTKDNQS